MSCLNVTAWYQNVPYEEHEKRLIMGKYPVEFIQELREADNINFFGNFMKRDFNIYDPKDLDLAIALGPTSRADDSRPIEFRGIPAQPSGTLLPFSLHGSAILQVVAFHTDVYECHRSQRTWTIRVDGRVSIPEACILKSSIETMGTTQTVTDAFIIAVSGQDENDEDLQHWLSTRSFECHAVVISSRSYYAYLSTGPKLVSTMCHGIILGLFSKGLYVRLGHFTCTLKHSELPAASRVDWLVA
jgi:hypothetical protein